MAADRQWSAINHKDIHPPPAMQMVFRSAHDLAAILTQKTLFLACDLAILGLLIWWLPGGVSRSWRGLCVASLVVVEVAASGHNDPFGVLWLVPHALDEPAPGRGTIACALAFLAKFTTASRAFLSPAGPRLLGCLEPSCSWLPAVSGRRISSRGLATIRRHGNLTAQSTASCRGSSGPLAARPSAGLPRHRRSDPGPADVLTTRSDDQRRSVARA